ncbi:MFS transporter, partial [Streptomyces sp. ATE26]|nr:MFS transporter [Streptomyces sp. ATE26]
KTCQAAFMIAGGLIAAAAGVRGALLIAGLVCMASTLLLPWRMARSSAVDVPAPVADSVSSQVTDSPLT